MAARGAIEREREILRFQDTRLERITDFRVSAVESTKMASKATTGTSQNAPSSGADRGGETESRAIRSVGIVSRPRREEVAAVVPALLAWLAERGVVAYCDPETATCVGPTGTKVHAREEMPSAADLIIVLGGDGTLLAAARLVAKRRAHSPRKPWRPGISDQRHPRRSLSCAATGAGGQGAVQRARDAGIEGNRDGQVLHQAHALNDAVLNKSALARIIDLTAAHRRRVCDQLQGRWLDRLHAHRFDGLFACGRRPHRVSHRFGVCDYAHLPAHADQSSAGDSRHVADRSGICRRRFPDLPDARRPGGHGAHCPAIVFRSAPRQKRLRLVRPQKKSYFSVLRDKLKWGER